MSGRGDGGEPRLARRLLRRLLPPQLREPVLADLREQYRVDRSTHGRLTAALRYWSELIAPSLWVLRREARSAARERPLLATAWTELRHAARSLRMTPGFTLAAVATLTIGIGATTFVFTVFAGVLIEPLPYAEPRRIAMIWADLGDGAQSLPAVNALDVEDYRRWSSAFEEFTLATGRELILTDGEESEIVDMARVEAGFFPFLGVRPALGRNFTAEEDVPDGPPVAILSHRLWSRRYGADPDLVGKSVEVEGLAFEVVGVLPASFRLLLPPEAFLLRDADVWVPVRIDPEDMPPRNFTGYTVLGRLVPGVSFAAAGADMEAVAERLRQTYPVHADARTRLRAVPLHHDVVKGVAPALRLLMGAVALVLLVVCANVAHLLLARGMSRDRELAVRSAMGAGRGRIALGLLLESLLLGGLGAVAGAGLAHLGLEALRRAPLSTIPRLGTAGIDGRVLGFVVVTSLGAVLVSCLAPLLRGMRTDPAGVLRDGGRSGVSSHGRRFRHALVMGEVSVSLVLLVASGLLLRSFVALQGVDPGFDPDRAMTFRVRLPLMAEEYGADAGQEAFFTALRERLEALPGVESASAVTQLPLTGSGALQPFAYDEETARDWESVTADERRVLEGFFATAGATLVAGRDFTPADREDSTPVAIVDESLAAMAWPGEPAVGKRLQVEPGGDADAFVEIVGVTRHVRLHDVASDGLPQLYLPYRQGGGRLLSFVVRAGGDPQALEGPVRELVASMDERVAVDRMRTLESLLQASLERERLSFWLMAGFGLAALLLVSVGLYGVVSWSVASRTRELGVRVALGAAPDQLRRSVLAQALRLVAPSLAVGAFMALLLGRSLRGLLHGVEALDPLTLLVVCFLLLLVALAACWAPARRATRVDPLAALRSE